MRHGAVTHRVIAVISPTSNLHHYKYVPVAQVFSHIAEPCLSLDPSLQRHGVFTVHGQSFHFDTEDTGPVFIQVQINTARGPLDALQQRVFTQEERIALQFTREKMKNAKLVRLQA